MDYTCSELARVYGKTRQSVANLVRKGVIKAEMIDGIYYINQSEIDKLPYSWKRKAKNGKMRSLR